MAKNTHISFTKQRLEGLPVPDSGRVYWYDERTPKLCLCVTANDVRTFYVYGRMGGQPKRFRLGRFPEVTIDQARRLTAKRLAEVADGKDPQAEKQAKRKELTIGDLFHHWIENYAKRNKKTWKEDERNYNNFLSQWKDRPLSSIARKEVADLHTRIGDENGRYAANRVLELLKAAFNRGEDELDYEGGNPARKVKAFREEERDRYATPEELPKFFAALDDEEPIWRDFFMLALFTGARRSNLQAMRWAEIQGDVWRIPETKSGKPVLIPLVPDAVAILEQRRPTVGNSEWVFPSPRKSAIGHIQEPKSAWQRIRNRAGLGDLRMHDLRRTLGSWQAANGASLPIIGKSLGHGAGSRATQVYARLQLDPVRASVNGAVDAMVKAGKRTVETNPQEIIIEGDE